MDRKDAAFICPHVFADTRPILLVSREGGDWQFLCGGEDHPDDEKPHLVRAQHLFDRDRRLLELLDLPDDWDAERSAVDAPWVRRPSSE